MAVIDLNWAKRAAKALGLPEPIRPFGNASQFGKIFELSGGRRVMKVMPASNNTAREMKIARIAGNANIGPKVYNTRRYGNWHVMTMDKVLGATSLANAIREGIVTNFRNVEEALKRLHAAGIHHGNLHGYNILVYKNANGRVRLVPIDFGAATYNQSIRNMNSAVQTASRGTNVQRIQGINYYTRPGAAQKAKSNRNSLEAIRRLFNKRPGSVTPPSTPARANSLPRNAWPESL